MNEVELTVSAGRRDPGSLRLVATLAVAGALSGLVLASVFQITKPVIDANKARAIQAGVLEVVPGATSIRKFALRDGRLEPVTGDAVDAAPVIYGAYDDAEAFTGWAMLADGPGFQDTIRVLYGYDPARRRVTGMRVLESRETPGLGDKIFKDAAFVATFEDLAVDPEIVLVKKDRSADNEVDAITGATISSQAVVRMINEAHARWSPVLPAPGEEPPP
jgi:electron transport complex protein RnfG